MDDFETNLLLYRNRCRDILNLLPLRYILDKKVQPYINDCGSWAKSAFWNDIKVIKTMKNKSDLYISNKVAKEEDVTSFEKNKKTRSTKKVQNAKERKMRNIKPKESNIEPVKQEIVTTFNQLTFDENNGIQEKKSYNYKKILNEDLEFSKNLNNLKKSGNNKLAYELSSKKEWDAALTKAKGEKYLDAEIINKKMKHKLSKKIKSTKEWNKRIQTNQEEKERKQLTKLQNIQNRKKIKL